MTYPSYFPDKYRYKLPQRQQKPKPKQKLLQLTRTDKQFIELAIILGALSALALTLARH